MITIVCNAIRENLRGYITRFLLEVNAGVYVGDLSKRVRDNLIDKIDDAIINDERRNSYAIIMWEDGGEGVQFHVSGKSGCPFSIVDFQGLSIPVAVDYMNKARKSSHSTAYYRHRMI